MIYRTRPVFVEAYMLMPLSAEALAAWCHGTLVFDTIGHLVGLDIPTLHGTIRALVEMYVIKEQDGHFNIMPAREFAGKFELI